MAPADQRLFHDYLAAEERYTKARRSRLAAVMAEAERRGMVTV